MNRFGMPAMLVGLGLIVHGEPAAWVGFLVLGAGAVLYASR